MRLSVLVRDATAVSVRFRITQLTPYLEQAGVSVQLCDLTRERNWHAALKDADRVLVHRVLLRLPDWLRLRRAAPGYLFDFDDAIYLRPTSGRHASWQRRMRFMRMVSGAKTVLAGSEALAQAARVRHSDVRLVPTTVRPEEYRCLLPNEARPVVGWIGTAPNLPYLATIAPALQKIALHPARPLVRIISNAERFSLADVPIEYVRWSMSGEAQALAGLSVGLMPLPDDPWTRGKCGCKLLQYMASGVASLCSPVGANIEIVRDGIDGLHARTPGEWEAQLTRLLDDASLRARLGAAGRARVCESFSASRAARLLLEALP